MSNKSTRWKWRDGELSLKEFYQLTYEKRKEYILFLESIPVEEQSTGDEYLIRMYSKKKPEQNNFLEL